MRYADDLMDEVVKSVTEVLTEKYKFALVLKTSLMADIEAHLVEELGDKFTNMCEMAANWDDLNMDYDDPRETLETQEALIEQIHELVR